MPRPSQWSVLVSPEGQVAIMVADCAKDARYEDGGAGETDGDSVISSLNGSTQSLTSSIFNYRKVGRLQLWESCALTIFSGTWSYIFKL